MEVQLRHNMRGAGMKQYEYMRLITENRAFLGELNRLGEDGWRFCRMEEVFLGKKVALLERAINQNTKKAKKK